MLRAVIAVMQFMISAQAGLVNYVEGPVNVQLHEQVRAGMPIETGPQGHAEILLNPGAFLRIGENSTVVLDSVELTHVFVHVVKGAALIESAEVDKQTPIHVTAGNLNTLIVSPGLYRFSDDIASVIDGKLRTSDSSVTVKKGNEVATINGRYQKRKITVNAEVAELDRWSEQRSFELARANALAYRDRSSASLFAYGGLPYWALFSNRATWFYSVPLNGFTLIPRYRYTSYWGYGFVPALAFGGGGLFLGTTRNSGGTTRTFGTPTRPIAPPQVPRPIIGRAGSPQGPPGRAGGAGSVSRPSAGRGFGGAVGRSRGFGGARSGGFGGHR